ncbi:MAG TPA: sialidase family protein [Candidatus Dormibacteraeota bacterium]|nr:sialidase family protein [Candidatus Dormibacteraeota bacterium]
MQRFASNRRILGLVSALAVAILASGVGASAKTSRTASSDVQTNLIQNGPFPQNKQNEPAIAQNPTDSTNLIAGANDEIDLPACTSSGCPFVANVGLSGVYVSHDSGASWNQFSAPAGGDNTASFNGDGSTIHTLPGFAKLARQVGLPGLASDGDPGLAFSADGTAYYSSLAGVRGTTIPDLITVSSSKDGGTTWSDPVLATNKANPVDFNDKIAIWVDQSPTSPFKGNVYVSWTLFVGIPGNAAPIMFSRSTDGGQTWSPAQKLSASFNNRTRGGRQGSTIKTDANGNVYVIWESGVTINGAKTDAQVFAKSTDGGASFGKQATIAPVNDLPDPLPGSSFRNDSFPAAAIDQVHGTIYVSWADYDFTAHHGKVLLASSSDNGASWSTVSALDVAGRTAFFNGVAVSPDGSKVSVATQALNDVPAGTAPGPGVVNYGSFFAESADGVSFSAPVVISSAFSDPDVSSTNSLGAQFLGDYNTMVSDNAHAWFIWTDGRNGATCAAVDAFRAGTAPRPNEPASCPANFGNTDIFVATIGL